jgi:RHS repeat-associated protein
VNQLTNRFNSGQGFEYDKAGNIIKDSSNGQVRNFIFNGDNKQVHVKDANNVAIGTYFYDGEGKRVKKTTASETTVFVYDGGGKLVAEYSTQQNSNPTVSYTATDPLGSPRVITDKNGNVISRRDFMPFGEELNANTATNRLETAKYNYGEDNIRKRFTGYEKDLETGLDFAEARYYNNKHGRFTAVDPLLASGKSANPQSFNRYIYVMNNPLRHTDPSGLQAGTPTGKWHVPVTADGSIDPSRSYSYILNGASTEGYSEITERNKRGELIGSRQGYDGDRFVMRFNPLGPRGYKNGVDIVLDIAFGPIGGEPYNQYGWDMIRTDEAQDSYNKTGLVVNSIEPIDVAILLSPMKGGAVGKGAMEMKVAEKETAAFVKELPASSSVSGSNLGKSLASEAQMSEAGGIIAGQGSKNAFRDAPRVAATYGGNAADWVKKSSSSYTAPVGKGAFEMRYFETHWVENMLSGTRVEFKTKFPLLDQ